MVRKLVFGLSLIMGLFLLMVPQSIYAAAGDVWIQPSYTSVSTNSAFTLEVHTDTNAENLGAYQFTITFDPALINVDTAQGTDGVATGTDGFIAVVNTNNTNGTIIVNGFDVTGTGPGSDLQVLIIYFDALNNAGQSTIGLTVDSLTNELGDTIGTPNGIDGSITVADNDPPSAFQLLYPEDGQTGLGTTVEFEWEISTDPDGDLVTYDLYYCTDPDPLNNCSPIQVTSFADKAKRIYYAGVGYGAWLMLFGTILAGGIKDRKRIALLIAIAITTGMLLVSCGDSNDGSDNNDGDDTGTTNITYIVSNLDSSTRYYWLVVAKDNQGGETLGDVRSFITQ